MRYTWIIQKAKSSKLFLIAAAALLALVCALLYGMTLAAPLIYDDVTNVRDNPLWAFSGFQMLVAALSRDYFALTLERTYQPLVTLFHFVTHDNPLVYRVTGLLLHAFNGWLVLRVGLRLGQERRAALLAALLFCAYPASTEAVNISSFKGHLLGFSFGLLALEAWLVYLEKGTARILAVVAALYGAALFSKETSLAAGLLCAAAWLCLNRRRERLAGMAVLAGVSAAYLAWRFLWLRPAAGFTEVFRYSPPASLAWYLRMLVWPWPLCLERAVGPGAWTWAALAGYAAGIWMLRRRPRELWLAAWIGLALTPFLHFIAFANFSPVADRYLYLPVAGFCLLLAQLSKRSALAALCGLLAVWGGVTARRNGLYRSERSIFEQTSACAPSNPRAQSLYGLACLRDGDPAAGEAAFRRVLRLRESAGAHTLLGEALFQQGKVDDARGHYRRALALDPEWAAHYPGAADRLKNR
ncbi:MAG: tetratricopeptide repeat protein [Elusimicrobiota bacterium]